MDPTSATCPKCDEPAEQSGTLTLSARDLPVYQCDTCVRMVESDGSESEEAFTFAVGVDGVIFDPGTSTVMQD